MKTFVASVIIFVGVGAFVVLNMLAINKITGEMFEICASLPKSEEEFYANYEAALEATERLWELWDRKIDRIAYTVGYENIDRADDAMTELYSSAKNKDGGDYITAGMKFYDAILRLRELESFDIQSVM